MENTKDQWSVQYKGEVGGFGKHYEISVIHKDNSHGRFSWGWGGMDKIILFSSGVGGNPLRLADLEFALKAAQILCDGMNETD